MDTDNKSKNTKRTKIEGYKGYVFGVCNRCNKSINYPAVRIPSTCDKATEVGKNGVLTYQVTYIDMHVECATYTLVHSEDVEVKIDSTVQFKKGLNWFKNWLANLVSSMELIEGVDSKLTINQRNNKGK